MIIDIQNILLKPYLILRRKRKHINITALLFISITIGLIPECEFLEIYKSYKIKINLNYV